MLLKIGIWRLPHPLFKFSEEGGFGRESRLTTQSINTILLQVIMN